MAGIDVGIQTRLSNHAGLNALVVAIYSVIAPSGQPQPFISWNIFDEALNEHMGSSSTPTTVMVQVSSFTDTKQEQEAITVQLKSALSRYRGAEGGVTVQDSFYQGYNDRFDVDENYYQRDHDFEIHYEE